MFLTTERLDDDLAARKCKDSIKALSAMLKVETDPLVIARIVSDATDGTFEYDECLEQLEHFKRLTGNAFAPYSPEWCTKTIGELVRVERVPNIRIRHALEERTCVKEGRGRARAKDYGVDKALADSFTAQKCRIEGRPETLSKSNDRAKQLEQMFGLRPDGERVTLFTAYNDMLAMSRALGFAPHEVGV